MSETGSFLNSTAGQVALIGGVAFAAFYFLKSSGKETAKAVTDTAQTLATGAGETIKTVVITQPFDYGYQIGIDVGKAVREAIDSALSNLKAEDKTNTVVGTSKLPYDTQVVGGGIIQGKTDSSLNDYTKFPKADTTDLVIPKETTPQQVAGLATAAAKVYSSSAATSTSTPASVAKVASVAASIAPSSQNILLAKVADAVGYTSANPAVAKLQQQYTASIVPASQMDAEIAQNTAAAKVTVTNTPGYVTTDTALRGAPMPSIPAGQSNATAGGVIAQWNAANQIDAATGKYMK